MISRPKTGFKQKNPQELTSVNIEDIEKYVDLLYEQPEEKIKGTRFLLYLIQSLNNMYTIAEVEEKLLDVISRTLRDEHKKIRAFYIFNLFFLCFFPI